MVLYANHHVHPSPYYPPSMDSATTKFEQAIPFALQPSHPQLAALHASRSCAIPHSACAKCSSMLTLSTRVVRGKHNTRAIVTTCYVCGEAASTPVEKGNAAAFPPYRRRAVNMQAERPRAVHASAILQVKPTATSNAKVVLPTTRSSEAPSTPVPEVSSASRPNPKKKKSTLQEMLKRNRENETKRTNVDTKPSGLSTFLGTL